ncbi:MAG: hypothetical protein O7B26_00740 [Planctomycetota bacterium]|nr:hypothetical protein [Planctomycetota bacterium]
MRHPNSISGRMTVWLGTVLIGLSAGGCEDVDWHHWDAGWWKDKSRVVRPRRKPLARPTSRPTDPDTTPPPSYDPEKYARKSPFQQLYLLSGSAAGQTGRGDQSVSLTLVSARACAGVLESLYVPTGRLGAQDESYLIFEEEESFRGAGAFAPTLDVKPLESASPPEGPDASFVSGIGLYYGVYANGAVVDRTLVDVCERHLAVAAQSEQVSARKRWAAAVLAGRLVAEYRYDDGAARSYYRQAERVSEDGSIEQMTARWWVADALVRQGDQDAAARVYQTIVEAYADRPESEIVRRAKAWLEQRR